MKALIVLGVNGALWLLIAFFCSSCGTTSGWRVQFGVAPVAAIAENQTTLDKRK